MRASVYARISTSEGKQNLDTQLYACRQFAERHDIGIYQEYTDMASAVDMKNRKQWRALLDDLERLQPRIRPKYIIVARLDRVIRSLTDMYQIKLRLRAIDVRIATVDGLFPIIDEANPMQKAFYDGIEAIVAAIAEIELKMIQDRVRAGVQRRQARGLTHGRPVKDVSHHDYLALPPDMSVRKKAAALGISTGTLHNRVREWSKKGLLIPAEFQLLGKAAEPVVNKHVFNARQPELPLGL